MKPTSLNAELIAEVVLNYATLNGYEITHLKLQKLLYYIQGWSSAYLGAPLFNEEPEAWVNGPVYKSVWSQYKGFSDGTLKGNIISSQDIFSVSDNTVLFSEEQKDLIIEVLDSYIQLSTSKLVEKTHNESPWINARGYLKVFQPSTNKIKLMDIQTYFQGKVSAKNA